MPSSTESVVESRGGEVEPHKKAGEATTAVGRAAESTTARSRAEIEKRMRRERARAARSTAIQEEREASWFAGRRRVFYIEDLSGGTRRVRRPPVEDKDPIDAMHAQNKLRFLGTEPPAHLDLRRVDKAARVRAMLDLMEPDSARILTERFIERLDLRAMAERRGIRYQSMQGQLETACQDFVRVCGEHWTDDIDITLEDF
jgi:hypothetical protein